MRFDFAVQSKADNIFESLLTTNQIPRHVFKISGSEKFEQKQSAVFLFDSFEAYWNFEHNQRRYINYGPMVIKNLVFCLNAKSEVIEKAAQDLQNQ